MKSNYWLAPLCVSLSLVLAACGGSSGTTSGSGSGSGSTNYQLTVTAPASGSGTITSNPAGINCPTTCTASFAQNTQVTLTATAGTNFYFGGWSGNCTGSSTCTVTMTAAETVGATFNAGVGVTVAMAGAGTGSVTSSPTGINCPATCSAGFPPNTTVILTEVPAANNVFAGWSGGCTGTAACTLNLSASSNVTATFGGTLQSSINHIIFFAQENRSFDHYFGYMRQYWANTGVTDQSFDGLPQFNPVSGMPPLQGPVPSVPGCNLTTDVTGCTPDTTNPISSFTFHGLSVCQENQSPFWNEAHNDWDLADPSGVTQNPASPPLNGFVYTSAYDARSNGYQDVNGVRAMGYYEDSDLNYYYSMATNFGTSDRWFSPIMSRTQLNRMYMLSATSQGRAYPIPTNGTVLTAKPIFQALQDAGITWKIYVDPTNVSNSNRPCTDTISDANGLCLIQASYINMFAYESTIINSAGKTPDLLLNIVPISQFAKDAAAGTLPQFAFIEPPSNAGDDEHPSDSDQFPVNVQTGATYVAETIMNPLMQSPSWTDSALIFTYDEAGGYYDHVPPQPMAPPGDIAAPTDLQPGDICDSTGTTGGALCNFGWTGYRVPVIVISPYSVKNYVSHTVRDYTSALAMVEARFGLPALTGRDAAQPSMNEFFDFVNKPWATPPTPPAQNTGEACNQTPPPNWIEPPVLTVVPTGSGSVASSPSGISACTSTGGPCSAPYATGTVVTLTATPATGSTFTGWSGACSGTSTCSVTVTGATSVNATFTP